MIEVGSVTKSFKRDDGSEVRVLQGASFQVPPHTFVSLIGPNGCGKTTLLQIIAGLLQADEGWVEINGDRKRRQVGFVWQDYRASLLPQFDVLDNISLPLRIKGVDRQTRRDRARELLRYFPTKVIGSERCYELSGGQQQLVSLLRSIIVQPEALLLDEPFASLDQQTRWIMASEVERIWLDYKMPTLLVSHEVDEAILMADQVLLMRGSGGGIASTVQNPLPRPRRIGMLKSAEHHLVRDEVMDFILTEQGTQNDSVVSGRERI